MSTYLLSIGINDYTDRAFKALTCCENDATEIHALFKRNLDLGERARKLVGRVTTVDVKNELRRIRHEIRNGDTFVFFFAGHGYQHPKREDQFLLFPEAEARLVNKGYLDGMLSLSALCELTDDWAGVARVFVLDACRSWLPGERSAQGEAFDNESALAYIASRDPRSHAPTRPASGSQVELQSSAQALPPLILNATKNGEIAQELERQGRGVLALALERTLEAQSRAGEVVWLGQHNLGEIGEEMQRLLRADGSGASQTPFMVPSGGKALLYKPRVVAPERVADENTAGLASSQLATEPMPEERASEPAHEMLSPVGNETLSLEERWQKAVFASHNGDDDTAFKLVGELADEGYPAAINWKASWCYYGSHPAVMQDKAEGRRLFEQAVELGDANAMRNLALVLKEGNPSAEDVALSNTWMERALQAGCPYACVDLCIANSAGDELQQARKPELEARLETIVTAMSGDDPWLAINIARFTAFGPQSWRRLDLARLALTPWQDATEALHSPAAMVSRDWDDPLHEIQVINAWLLETEADATEADKKKAASIYANLHQATNGVQPGKSLGFFAMSAEHGLNSFWRDPRLSLAFLERGAALGDVGMQHSLARTLAWGHLCSQHDEIVCPVDEARARELLVQSSNNGNIDAMVDLACRYSDGLWGIETSPPLARQWVDKALQEELTFYQLHSLAEVCQKGQGALNDDQLEASIWQRCLKMASGGEYKLSEAMLSYALQLWEGRGVQQNRIEAVRLLDQSVAASSKEVAGCWEFAIAASFAKEVVYPGIHEHRGQVDSEAALVWLKKSAEAGYREAMWTLAHSRANLPSEFAGYFHAFAHLPEDKAESLRWLRKLSELGDEHASEVLAFAFLHGKPYDRDVDAAEKLLDQLERLWSEKAEFQKMLLVARYWDALGDVLNSRQKSGYWRNLARKFGGAAAARSLALEMAQRAQDGQSELTTQAFRLMEEAARSGDLSAMLETGLWLLKGYGVPVDEGAADQWFSRYTAKWPDDSAGAETERAWNLAQRLLQATPRDLTRGMKWLEMVANGGNADALLSCGIACAEGIGRERDLARAEQYFGRLFELDPASAAQRLLAMQRESIWDAVLEHRRMSDIGRIIAFKLCAQRGAPEIAGEALYAIGNIYSSGRIVEMVDYDARREDPDFAEAFHWHKLSAEKAHSPAYEALAECFAEGRGTNVNQALAQQWWLRAANSGSNSAMIALGVRAYKGIGQSPDARGAREWFNKAALQSDDACLAIAEAIFDAEDVTTHGIAHEWLMQSVNRKSTREAYLAIAKNHARGWGVGQSLDEADRWLEKYATEQAPENDNGKPLRRVIRVAEWWRDDRYLIRNPERAVAWLRRAADMGHAESYCLLGEAYATGYGVSVNAARSEEWLLKGASSTDPWEARMRLVYWWARWERKDKSVLAETWLGEIAKEDRPRSWELTKAAVLAAYRVFGPASITDNQFRQMHYLSHASYSYKYGCELALLGMAVSNGISQTTLLAVKGWLFSARHQIKKDQSGCEVVGDTEIAYVEGLCSRANQLKPRHWLLRWFGA